MEKFAHIQKNSITDEELDQISGGRAVIDAFTTEFRGSAIKPTTLEMNPDEKNHNFDISTLEIKDDPLRNQETNKPKKTLKI
jgi:bacteriocin-like protein